MTQREAICKELDPNPLKQENRVFWKFLNSEADLVNIMLMQLKAPVI